MLGLSLHFTYVRLGLGSAWFAIISFLIFFYFILPTFFKLLFSFSSFQFSSGLFWNQMTGIGIRLGLYGGKMTVSYGWMDGWMDGLGSCANLYTSFL